VYAYVSMSYMSYLHLSQGRTSTEQYLKSEMGPSRCRIKEV